MNGYREWFEDKARELVMWGLGTAENISGIPLWNKVVGAIPEDLKEYMTEQLEQEFVQRHPEAVEYPQIVNMSNEIMYPTEKKTLQEFWTGWENNLEDAIYKRSLVDKDKEIVETRGYGWENNLEDAKSKKLAISKEPIYLDPDEKLLSIERSKQYTAGIGTGVSGYYVDPELIKQEIKEKDIEITRAVDSTKSPYWDMLKKSEGYRPRMYALQDDQNQNSLTQAYIQQGMAPEEASKTASQEIASLVEEWAKKHRIKNPWGKSGITLGVGVDLAQHGEKNIKEILSNYDLKEGEYVNKDGEYVFNKLKKLKDTYIPNLFSAKGKDAYDIANKHHDLLNFTLVESDINFISNAFMKSIESELEKLWNGNIGGTPTKKWQELKEGYRNAIMSLGYNVGSKKLSGYTILKQAKQGKWKDVADHFHNHRKWSMLHKRRKHEGDMVRAELNKKQPLFNIASTTGVLGG